MRKHHLREPSTPRGVTVHDHRGCCHRDHPDQDRQGGPHDGHKAMVQSPPTIQARTSPGTTPLQADQTQLPVWRAPHEENTGAKN